MHVYAPCGMWVLYLQKPEGSCRSLGTEVKVVVIPHEGAGNQIGSSARAANSLSPKPSVQAPGDTVMVWQIRKKIPDLGSQESTQNAVSAMCWGEREG